MRAVAILAIAMTPPSVAAQVASSAEAAHGSVQDSVHAKLPLAEFVASVRRWHPVARQAASLVEQARGEQQVARGAFDPVLAAGWERKTYGGTEYYDYGSAKLVAPTPWGPDLVLGWERADGRYIAADRRTPGAGLLTAGVTVPIGQRLLTDERRTALAVAAGLRAAADAERDAALNRVVLQAVRDYAAWFETSRREAVADQGVVLAQFRLQAIRRRVLAGEAAAIDSLEAALETRRREVLQGEARQAMLVARLKVEAHLWSPSGEPVALPDRVAPAAARAGGRDGDSAVDSAAIQRWVRMAERTHPDLRRGAARVAQLVAQRRLVAQQLLPATELHASALASGGDGPAALDDAGRGNAKVGGSARLPVLLLRERGRLRAADAREEQQRLDLVWNRRQVVQGVRAVAGELAMVERLAGVQREAVRQAMQLRDGEQRRFEAGESTLFLVNARERLVLDEDMRLAGLEAKRLVLSVELSVAIGLPAGSAEAP